MEDLEDDSKIDENVLVIPWKLVCRKKTTDLCHSRNIEDDSSDDSGDDVGTEDAAVTPQGDPVLVGVRGADSVVTLHCEGNSQEYTRSDWDMAKTVWKRREEKKKRNVWNHGLDGQYHIGEDDQKVHNAKSNQYMVEHVMHLPAIKTFCKDPMVPP